MKRVITDEPFAVQNRLAELGWSSTELIEVVTSMVAARHGCTANDPLSAPGWMSWKAGIRRMGEIGAPKGLRRVEIDNVPWTMDQERRLRFTVTNADAATGMLDGVPQNRNKRGAAAERAVDTNAHQYLLFPISQSMDPQQIMKMRAAGTVAWYLFVYTDGEEIRAELSCPVAIHGGFFVEFVERIFLNIPDTLPPIDRQSPFNDGDEPEEFDVPVSRI
jgi:hypothetical protein